MNQWLKLSAFILPTITAQGCAPVYQAARSVRHEIETLGDATSETSWAAHGFSCESDQKAVQVLKENVRRKRNVEWRLDLVKFVRFGLCRLAYIEDYES